MPSLLSTWRKIISSNRPRKIRGAYWYRAVLKSRKKTILTMDGAFLYGGRYNAAEDFGALYLSESTEGCIAEITRRPGSPDNYVVGEIEVTLEKVCDLTDARFLRKLEISKDQLIGDDWAETQLLGELVRSAGFEGMIVPSAAGDFTNLIIFIDNLSAKSKIQLENVHDSPLP